MLQNLVLGALLGLLAAGCGPSSAKGGKELHELAAAMDRRLQVAGDVAWAKQASQAPVRDAAREAAVLGRVADLAKEHGADPAAAREFVEAQMAASRQWQGELLERWRAGEPLPPGTAPDMAAELRPRMDLATRELIDAWAAWISAAGRTRFRAIEAQQILAHLKAAGYSESAARLACGVVVESGGVLAP